MNSDEETIKYLKERGLLEQIGNIMDSSYNDKQLEYDLKPHEEDYEWQKKYDLEQEKNFNPGADRTTGDPKFMMEIKRMEDSIRNLPDYVVEDYSDNPDLKTEYERREMEKRFKADSAYNADLESEPSPESGSIEWPKGEQYYMKNDSLKDDGLDKDEAINQRVEKELNRLRDRTKAYENGEINARDLSLKEQLYRSGDSALIKMLERLAAENDIEF